MVGQVAVRRVYTVPSRTTARGAALREMGCWNVEVARHRRAARTTTPEITAVVWHIKIILVTRVARPCAMDCLTTGGPRMFLTLGQPWHLGWEWVLRDRRITNKNNF